MHAAQGAHPALLQSVEHSLCGVRREPRDEVHHCVREKLCARCRLLLDKVGRSGPQRRKHGLRHAELAQRAREHGRNLVKVFQPVA
jgi:hypothetical protein